MTDPSTASSALAAALHRGLRRHRFPFRRDVALDGRSWGSGSAFVDHRWIEDGRLAVVVAALEEGDVLAASRLSCFRYLLWAACDAVGGTQGALDETIATFGALFPSAPVPDCALALLQAPDGTIEAAVHGAAACRHVETEPRRAPMPEGQRLLHMTAGRAASSTVEIDPDWCPREALEHRLADVSDCCPGGAVAFARIAPGGAGARDLVLVLENRAQEVEPAQARMEAFLRSRAVPQEVVLGLAIAFDEVFTNIVSYAHADARRREIILTLSAGADTLVLELRDDGRPFDPRGKFRPAEATLGEGLVGGLGIDFVRQLTDEMHYDRSDGWNVLTLRKRFAPAAGSLPETGVVPAGDPVDRSTPS